MDSKETIKHKLSFPLDLCYWLAPWLTMAASFAVRVLLISLLFTTFISISFTATAATALKPKPIRFAVPLIHCDSPLSPFRNPKTTLRDRSERVLESSIARYAYLSAKQRGASTINEFRTAVTYDGYEFLAKFSIGTPRVDVFLIVDTGSQLIWTQCEPCMKCYPQTRPLFDRTKSSTYANFTCNDPKCNSLPDKVEECNTWCMYNTRYGDGDESFGLLGRDSFTFNTTEGVLHSAPDVAFGCGVSNDMKFMQKTQEGVLGLAAGNFSMISQLRPITQEKFSYCLGNLSDPSSTGNLILGEDAYTFGKMTTPLQQDFFYYVTLVDISIGSQRLEIPPGTFARDPSGDGGVIMDIGTILTVLDPVGYNIFGLALTAKLKAYRCFQISDPLKRKRFCYMGDFIKDLDGFPTVTFHFKDDADLVLERWSVFSKMIDGIFCLAFIPGKLGGLSVIGNKVQQTYNFGFHLERNELSFERLDCSIP